MRRERQAVEADQPRGLDLAHAGAEAEEHVAHALRGEARRELEGGKLIDLVDRAKAVVGGHEDVGGVDHRARSADQGADRVRDVGRDFQRAFVEAAVPGAEILPADDAHPRSGARCPRSRRMSASDGAAPRGWPSRLKVW